MIRIARSVICDDRIRSIDRTLRRNCIQNSMLDRGLNDEHCQQTELIICGIIYIYI